MTSGTGHFSKPSAIIIGAGFTGCALAHDLALRGFDVRVFERGDIAAGTSGRTHGLLHSGARYCVSDPEAGLECMQENNILRRIAKQCIEFNGGLFIALSDQDRAYAADFAAGAAACGIPIEPLTPAQALSLEPALNPKLQMAFTVPDGSFDPLRLALAFAATARSNGAQFFTFHNVEAMLIDGQSGVAGIRAANHRSGESVEARADMVINATGAWAGTVSALAGASVPVLPTPGIMVAFDRRILQRVVNRLCPPADGDILIPQRRMVVIGTTSFSVEDADYIPIEADQIDQMIAKACELAPSVAGARPRGAYMSARPLIGELAKGRSLSRTFKCYDHETAEGIRGLVTITGGKATTCRAMAEQTADVVCQKLGLQAACQTTDFELLSYRRYYASQANAYA